MNGHYSYYPGAPRLPHRYRPGVAFDITEKGIARTRCHSMGKPGTSNRALIAVANLAVVFGIWGRWGGGTDGARSNVTTHASGKYGHREFEYYADGMTDDLISELPPMTDLCVISRTSVIPYKDSRKTIKGIGMPQEDHRGVAKNWVETCPNGMTCMVNPIYLRFQLEILFVR